MRIKSALAAMPIIGLSAPGVSAEPPPASPAAAPPPRQLTAREAVGSDLDKVTAHDLATMGANDTIYQIDSSRDYDPSARLGDISAYVMWVNSADDFSNPPELGIAEEPATHLKHGRFVLLPIGPNIHGHGAHTWAINWKDRLAELLAESAP